MSTAVTTTDTFLVVRYDPRTSKCWRTLTAQPGITRLRRALLERNGYAEEPVDETLTNFVHPNDTFAPLYSVQRVQRIETGGT